MSFPSAMARSTAWEPPRKTTPMKLAESLTIPPRKSNPRGRDPPPGRPTRHRRETTICRTSPTRRSLTPDRSSLQARYFHSPPPDQRQLRTTTTTTGWATAEAATFSSGGGTRSGRGDRERRAVQRQRRRRLCHRPVGRTPKWVTSGRPRPSVLQRHLLPTAG